MQKATVKPVFKHVVGQIHTFRFIVEESDKIHHILCDKEAVCKESKVICAHCEGQTDKIIDYPISDFKYTDVLCVTEFIDDLLNYQCHSLKAPEESYEQLLKFCFKFDIMQVIGTIEYRVIIALPELKVFYGTMGGTPMLMPASREQTEKYCKALKWCSELSYNKSGTTLLPKLLDHIVKKFAPHLYATNIKFFREFTSDIDRKYCDMVVDELITHEHRKIYGTV
jgi:hypothetical protein